MSDAEYCTPVHSLSNLNQSILLLFPARSSVSPAKPRSRLVDFNIVNEINDTIPVYQIMVVMKSFLTKVDNSVPISRSTDITFDSNGNNIASRFPLS